MKPSTVFLIGFLLFSCSCSIVDSNSSKPGIIGQWEWIRSSGGIMGEVLTPDSAGVSSRQLNFYNSKTYSLFRADTLVFQGGYSLNIEGDNIRISYDSEGPSPFNQLVKFTGSDTLTLIDDCADCYINTYTRIK